MVHWNTRNCTAPTKTTHVLQNYTRPSKPPTPPHPPPLGYLIRNLCKHHITRSTQVQPHPSCCHTQQRNTHIRIITKACDQCLAFTWWYITLYPNVLHPGPCCTPECFYVALKCVGELGNDIPLMWVWLCWSLCIAWYGVAWLVCIM